MAFNQTAIKLIMRTYDRLVLILGIIYSDREIVAYFTNFVTHLTDLRLSHCRVLTMISAAAWRTIGSFASSLYGLTASSTQTTARTCVRSARYARQSRRELNVPRRHPRTGGRFSRNVGKFRSPAENAKLNEAQINDVSRALAQTCLP